MNTTTEPITREELEWVERELPDLPVPPRFIFSGDFHKMRTIAAKCPPEEISAEPTTCRRLRGIVRRQWERQ